MYENGNTIKMLGMACAAAKAKPEKPPLAQVSHGTATQAYTQAHTHKDGDENETTFVPQKRNKTRKFSKRDRSGNRSMRQ